MVFTKFNNRQITQFLIKLKKEAIKPSLLLHSCCAPCSSYVLEYLVNYFKITIFYYNPNIYPKSEYLKRIEEQKKLIDIMSSNRVNFVEVEYCTQEFYAIVKGLEYAKEGFERCFKCYKLRLKRTAEFCKEKNYDYFTTTLSISPHKNAEEINKIGKELANFYKVKFLCADFKKNDGYKRSIILSKQYGFYRQNYCGCVFSKNIHYN